jgi:hypothetical protein
MIDAGVFRALDRELSISTDCEDVARYVRSVYRPSRIARISDLPHDRGSIVTRPGCESVYFNEAPLELAEHESGDPLRTGFYGSSRLFRESFRANPRWATFHAAAVTLGDRAALILGAPHSGKTSVTIALLDRGARLVSDEFVFVRRGDGSVSGLARTLAVRETGLEGIENPRIRAYCAATAPRVTPQGLRIWDFVDPVAMYGPDAFALAAALGAIFLLESGPGDRSSSLEPCSGSDTSLEAARRRVSGTGPGSATERMRRVAESAALFASTPAYRLRLGTPASGAALIEGALSGRSPVTPILQRDR